MKFQKSPNRPGVQRVHPAASENLPKRSYITNETKDGQLKQITMLGLFRDNETSFEETNDGYDLFHRAMSPVLTVGQYFGILPVSGIRNPNYTQLRFSWMSWAVIYTVLNMICSGFISLMCFLRMIVFGVDLLKTRGFIFYISTLIELALFLRLAQRWPALISSISRQERSRRLKKRSLHSRFSWWCFFMLFPALVEHALSFISGLAVAYDCTFGRDLAKSYFMGCFPQIFEFIEYQLWMGIVLQINNLISAFNWTFMDLFVIVISIGLTDRFDLLNNRLDLAKGKSLPEQFWKSVREEYAHISSLVKEVDTNINEIVFLSFANNLYFICVQLFNSLDTAHVDKTRQNCDSKTGPLRGLSVLMYFVFSFGFLLVRFLAVSLAAARINSAARQPASVLYSAPSSSYGPEAQRFLEQVVTDDVALTGMNFFNITRGLVLTIAGTIVTYELVLVQFNSTPEPVTANVTVNTCGAPKH